MGRRIALVVSLAMFGCSSRHHVAARPPPSEAMPTIEIRPGVAERIALMDRYRLHDEDRKHMMRRPRVWVEEVPEDEAFAPTDGGDTTEDAESRAASSAPP